MAEVEDEVDTVVATDAGQCIPQIDERDIDAGASEKGIEGDDSASRIGMSADPAGDELVEGNGADSIPGTEEMTMIAGPGESNRGRSSRQK